MNKAVILYGRYVNKEQGSKQALEKWQIKNKFSYNEWVAAAQKYYQSTQFDSNKSLQRPDTYPEFKTLMRDI